MSNEALSQDSMLAPRLDQGECAIQGARVKVTQVLYSGLGGHASVAFSLLGGDKTQKWDSSLLFVGIEPLVSAYLLQSQQFGVTFESIQSRQGQPWRSWASVYGALRRLAPEVVILHSISSLPPVALYCLVHGASLIAVEHTPLALKSRAERLMSALAFVFAERVVLLTATYRTAYLTVRNLFGRRDKAVVIPNGIDVAAFLRGEGSAKDGSFRIGMAARFSSTKRQDLLVLALAKLAHRRPDVRWRMTLAGDGDRLEAVRSLAAASGVAAMVDFMGHLDESELINWFRSLDLYAHASEGETLSTAMLQAMSMALPMIASPVPGICELLEGRGAQLGVLTAGNTPEAFADSISAVQSDPDLQAMLGTACRELVLSAYSRSTMFESYNNLIQRKSN